MIYFYRPLTTLLALTFDLDDTLYNNCSVIARSEKKLIQCLKKYHPSLYKLRRIDYLNLKRRLLYVEPEIYHDISYFRWKTIKLVMKNVGLNDIESKNNADTIMDMLLYWRNQISIPEETHNTLSALYNRWPLIAITNGNISLKCFGLNKYFYCILRAGYDGRAKPYKDMYHLAAKKLDVPPKTILHVGDNLITDVFGSIHYGMQSCWMNKRKRKNLLMIENINFLPSIEINELISLTDLL